MILANKGSTQFVNVLGRGPGTPQVGVSNKIIPRPKKMIAKAAGIGSAEFDRQVRPNRPAGT